jgi:hypothetical protein
MYMVMHKKANLNLNVKNNMSIKWPPYLTKPFEFEDQVAIFKALC